MGIFLLLFAAVSAVILVVHVTLAAGLVVNFARDAGEERNVPSGDARARLKAEVVVALRNEAENLPALLASLARQTDRDCLFLFVDDRSTDDTPRLVGGFAASMGPRVRVFRNEAVPEGLTGKQAALDLAFSEAKGDVLLFTDGDCVVPEGWARGMARMGWIQSRLWRRRRTA